MLRSPGIQICQKALFHSSATNLATTQRTQSALAKSLKPKNDKSGRLVVASKPNFSRDDAPHVGLKPASFTRAPRTPRAPTRPQASLPPRPRFGQKTEHRTSDISPIKAPNRSKDETNIDHDLNISDEFFRPSQPASFASGLKGKAKALFADDNLPTHFTSPPLLPGLVRSLKETLGPDVRPTAIQSLALQWLVANPPESKGWKQFLLAAETGSGKSIAYLLPMLQGIKEAELTEENMSSGEAHPKGLKLDRLHNPRGLVLAPTHELTRQLSGFAKGLLHETKLRVMCASQANEKSTHKEKDKTSRKLAGMMEDAFGGRADGEIQVTKGGHPIDVLVGTPMKVLEMYRGRGWDRIHAEEKEGDEEGDQEEEATRKPRRGRDFEAGWATKWRPPGLGLKNIEWVVVDEADVLFDSDFRESTRLLLSDISAARGHPVPQILPTSSENTPEAAPSPTPAEYPFHLILTSATIPNSLNVYLEETHPSLIRLASPRLHHLPKTLQTEYVAWSGGNKFADILRRVKQIWAEDSGASKASTGKEGDLSKVLIFCNKSSKVIELCSYLEEQGVKAVAMTSQSEHRGRGSNKHLAGFLRVHGSSTSSRPGSGSSDVKKVPHIMVTTSLLSRGLDFTPEIKHVFIVDEPRNMVDFLHRAGRSGRAGQRGKVVIFGKLKGRGSDRGRDVKRRVWALTK